MLVVFICLILAALNAATASPWTSALAGLEETDLFRAVQVENWRDLLFPDSSNNSNTPSPSVNSIQDDSIQRQLDAHLAALFPNFFPLHAAKFRLWSQKVMLQYMASLDPGKAFPVHGDRSTLLGLRAAYVLKFNLLLPATASRGTESETTTVKLALNRYSILMPSESHFVAGLVVPQDLWETRRRMLWETTTTYPTRKPITPYPTKRPTTSKPSRAPQTRKPTKIPTIKVQATKRPTKNPTLMPTKRPTNEPTSKPTKSPTAKPTKKPSITKSPTFVQHPAGSVSAARFDLRDYDAVAGIKDQGVCGSCYAFAATAVTEGRAVMQLGAPLRALSEQQIVSCADIGQCVGGWMPTVWHYTQHQGQVTRKTYPYMNYESNVPQTCQPSKLKPALIKTTNVDGYIITTHQLKLALLGGPVAISIAAYNPCFLQYKGGMLNCDCSQKYADVNHAVTVIGWNNGYWIVKNSWGTGWGENGYAKFPMQVPYPGTCGMFHLIPKPPKVQLV